MRPPVRSHRRHPARRMVAEQPPEHLEVLGHIATLSASRRRAVSASAATRPGSSAAVAIGDEAVDRLGGARRAPRRRPPGRRGAGTPRRAAGRTGTGTPPPRRTHRRARRRSGAAPPRCSPPPLRAAARPTASRSARPRRRESPRYCPIAICLAHRVVHGERAGERIRREPRLEEQAVREDRGEIADEDRHRLAEAPGSPLAPSSSARPANHAAVEGTPRRSFAPSIRSSWTSAIVCRSSSAAAARTIGSSRPPGSAPPAARKPQ